MRNMFSIKSIFERDYERYEGVRRINIYLLRLLFLLVVVFVGTDAWPALFTNQNPWDHVRAAAVCMWASYSVLSIFGFFNPLKWLPVIMFEILYKIVWLVVVAYPLWTNNKLAGSPAEEMTYAFLWVILPIVAMPWGYAFRNYILPAGSSALTR